jgi:hypothetical protein
MAIHVCCKRLFQMFLLFFRRMLQTCLFGCCICFTHILQLFYLNVAYVLQWLFKWFQGFFKCFRHTFQVFYLSSDVCCKCFIWIFKSRLSVAHVTMTPVTDGQRPAIGLQLLPCAFLTRRASPSPLLSSPSLTFPPSHYSISNSCG